ncbi:Mob1 family protein [Aspergillus affinis]|uniref:Mob1 family protein n=1 Tax=Aspergillus affinis TaxID=1070780 RepID=UPI0022FE59FD|nr:Mob1 family protein [Aspergillus affinis]KAI9042907.1 Mob1 family protein [Aspergillus affinis]
MAAAGVTHPSSPRLPSPPPFTEVQIGPKSPSVGESIGKDGEHYLGASHGADDGSTRRIRPGTKAVDMAVGPPLIPLSQLDSPFQLQEHLKALYNHYTRPEGTDIVVPISRDVAIQLAEPPEGIDRSLWLYELCRFLTMKVNNLIIAFFAENPPCSASTCPEMRASEWQYLCAVHDPPKSCCAIDYCCHTLDWATTVLTSPKYFPSRLTLGSEAGGGPSASMRHLTNIFRRLYRIFAHAWFQHREVFWQVEGHDGLYIFFKTVCDMYSLIPEDNYTIPAEAEGVDVHQPAEQPDGRRLTILRKDSGGSPNLSLEAMEPSSISTGATTRRHKNSPSTSSRVTTISESAEDDEQHPKESPQAATESAQKELEEPEPEEKLEPESEPEKPEPQSEAPEQDVIEEQSGPSEETSVDADGSQVTVAEVPEDEDAPKAPEDEPENKEQEMTEPSPEEPKPEEDQSADAAPVETSKPEPESESEPEKPSTAPEENKTETEAAAKET